MLTMRTRASSDGRATGSDPQPHGVDDLEDRGRGADAEREREDGNHGETGAPAQQACGVAEILSEAGEPDASVHVPGDLLHDHDVAELAANRGFGLGARLAPFHAVPHRHLDVPANLLVHGVGAARPELHDSLACRGERMPPMASTKRSQRERPDASSSRPFFVRR